MISVLLFASLAVADRGSLFETEHVATNMYEKFEAKALSSPDWNIHQNFRTVSLLIKQEDYAQLSESLEELKFLAGSRGYSDLPDYSLELLRNAAIQKDPFKSKFLVEKAVFLSPGDSRVAFAAASFYKILGVGKSIGLIIKGISKIGSQPLLLSAIILNLTIVGLLAFTIAIFITYFIQILKNSNNIREAIVPYMPWKYRGVMSVLALALIYIIPFFGGILAVLIVWAACLTLTINKRYMLIVGLLCALWGFALPKISTVAFNLNDPSSRVFEDLNLSRFSPKAEQYLQNRLASAPSDGTGLFFLAQTFRLKGFTDSARTLFEKIESLPVIEPELRKVGQANLGVVAFDSGEYSEALELLSKAEKDGMQGFELYYNLAITHLLLLDTDQYNHYYNLARGLDPARVSQIVTEKYLSPKAILIPVSSLSMIKPLFKIISSAERIELEAIEAKFKKVVAVLAGKLKIELVLVLGISMIVFAASLKSKKNQIVSASKSWAFFPFGRYIASNQIVFGIIGLGIVFSILLLSPTGVLNLYGSFSSFQLIYNEFLFLTLMVLIIFQILSLYMIAEDRDAR